MNTVPPAEKTPLAVSVVIPVFRDSRRAIALVDAMKKQRLPAQVTAEIIVVDDGSGDGTAAMIRRSLGCDVIFHELDANRGRAGARNFGAALSSGDVILFVDCDCLPADDTLIAAHLARWSPGVAATSGSVSGCGDGFWDRYQSEASTRRSRQHDRGMDYSGSSQNIMVSRRLFVRCGGFDESYRTYGFEDRDLLLRLSLEGRIAWAEDAKVRHMDTLSLEQVCRKMREAGGPAARLFANRHPSAYRKLGYARLDCQLNSWLGPPVRAIEGILQPAARLFDARISTGPIPHALKGFIVKILSGLSYAAGTAAR